MTRLHRRTARWSAAALLASVLLASASALAAPFVPTRDDQVVEQLPARLAGMRTLSQIDTAPAPDANEAVVRAGVLLDQARDRGDPRYAGYALAAIAPWNDDPAAPAALVVLKATLAQYQHDFDGARRTLERLLATRPTDPQALLVLATIARVQGRYADSDAACNRVTPALYSSACLAENAALRGRFDVARRVLASLIAESRRLGDSSSSVHGWLLTTLAELEERAGDPAAAARAFDEARALGRDAYLILDDVDLRIDRGDPAAALPMLLAEPQPYGDGVLLRLAIAAKAAGDPRAQAYAEDLGARFEAARLRGDAISIHGREYARFIDEVARRPRDALVVARDNLRIQKEPADFLVMAHAAHAANDAAALAEVTAEAHRIGLVDRRLDALVGAQPR